MSPAAMREGLLAFSTAAGLVVMQQMLTAELASIVGAKHARLGDERVGNWHGTTTGQVVLGGRKISVERPRGRSVDGGEVELATWDVFASEDLLRQVVVERMLAGVATRRHVEVAEPVGQTGTGGVEVGGVAPVRRRHREPRWPNCWPADLSGLETAVLMIDGLNVAGQMIVVALVITADGTKVPVGMHARRHREHRRGQGSPRRSRRPGAALRARHPRRARRLQGVTHGGGQGVRRPGPDPALHLAQAPKRDRLPARR